MASIGLGNAWPGKYNDRNGHERRDDVPWLSRWWSVVRRDQCFRKSVRVGDRRFRKYMHDDASEFAEILSLYTSTGDRYCITTDQRIVFCSPRIVVGWSSFQRSIACCTSDSILREETSTFGKTSAIKAPRCSTTAPRAVWQALSANGGIRSTVV